MLAYFSRYLSWYIPRHFHALRVRGQERLPQEPARTIICLNHASWWDPVISIVLSRALFPPGDHYAPMEASALGRYGFMRWLGLFPVDNQSSRAAAQFLRASLRILALPNSLLWVTPQGQFTDVRKRPAVWKPGLGALVHRAGSCTVIPLALEYTFWDERLPEALALIGEPLQIANGAEHSAEEWTALLSAELSRTQDALAELAMTRDARRFSTVLRGGASVSGVYGAWKRAQARLGGRQYEAEHGGLPPA